MLVSSAVAFLLDLRGSDRPFDGVGLLVLSDFACTTSSGDDVRGMIMSHRNGRIKLREHDSTGDSTEQCI